MKTLLIALFFFLAGTAAIAQGLARNMPQPDGAVRALVASGDTLFVGGDFRNLKQPGQTADYLGLYDTINRRVLASRPQPDGSVYSILPDGNNGLFIAGQFRSVGDSACYSVAWLDSAGQARNGLRNFGIGGRVNSLARIGDTLYIAGDFTQAGSNLLYTGGSPEFDTSGSLIRRLPKPNFPAKAILSDGQGGWIMAGPFTSIDGQPRQGLARIRPDGKLLDSWAPAIQGEARSLLLIGDTLFVGGTIAAINGQARGNLAALRFSTGVPIAWAPACNRPVEALASGNNMLFIGGSFTQIDNSQKGRFAVFNIPSLLPSNLGTSLDSTVRTLQFHNGFLYLGGEFRTAAGLPRRGLAVFDQTFLFPTTANAQLDGSVRSLSISNHGKLLIGGNFRQVGGLSRTNIALLDGPMFNVLPWYATLTGRIDWVAFWGNKVLVAGALDTLNGVPVSSQLLTFDSLTALPDSSLLPVGAVPTALAVSGAKLTYQSSADFNGGEVVSHFAAVDLNSGQMLPWLPLADLPVNCLIANNRRLFAGGRFVRISMFLSRGLAELNPASGQVVPGLPTPNGEVRTLEFMDSILLVGGNFTSLSNKPRAHFAAIYSGSKSLMPTNWVFDAPVSTLLSQTNGDLLLGGKFNLINGQNRRGLARINLLSGQLSSFGVPLSFGSEILTLVEDSQRVYFGGDFLSLNGAVRPFLASTRKNTAVPETDFLMASATIRSLAWVKNALAIGGDATGLGGAVRPGIAALSISSGQVLPWMPQAEEWVGYGTNGLNRRVETLLLNGNRLLAGGNFSTSAPANAQHFTAFDRNTGQISTALPQFSSEVRGFALHNNLLWVVGSFNSLNFQGNAISRSGIAALNPANLSPNNWTPSGFPVQLQSVKGLNASEIIVAGSTVGAYNTTNGNYRSYGFLGGQGRAVEVSGAAVIAGGLFTGASRFGLQLKLAPNQQNINAMDVGVPFSLNPAAEGVYALELGNGFLYAGGLFQQVNGQVQQNIGAFNLSNGNAIAFNPSPDSSVLSLLFHQNTLFCGGRFSKMFGQDAVRLAAIRPAFPLSIPENTNPEATIKCWPNPAVDQLFWNLPSEAEPGTTVQLFDLQGRKLLQTYLHEKHLSLYSLKPGFYLIQFNTPSPQIMKVLVNAY